ncbi:hypothetical protein MNBD_NITROSPIRAE02-1098 [hydrothermal vent metagenome]|uniref:Glycosyltransferase RgtA/B/C/D-like domain-containing protein n=1 Tax=hydrothermal vent metagenome TaxID=652676 RepID=A0A3B1CZI7_9ZZZZ
MKQERVIKYSVLFVLFFTGIAIGLLLWNRIELPFQNPWGVKGKLTEIQYNPSNDVVRFAVFLLSPVLLLSIAYLLGRRKLKSIIFAKTFTPDDGSFHGSRPPVKVLLPVLLIVFSIVVALNIPTFHATGKFDSFHEGETLGPAVSYMAGKTPYKDFIFLHGLYENPLRSVIAFRLFGRSIGSVRTLESIMKIAVFVLLSIFMLQLYRRKYLYSFTAIVILAFLRYSSMLHLPPLMFIKTRDITVFLFLITLAVLQDIGRGQDSRIKKLFMASFLFSFIPLASFGYSVDRGAFLFAAYLILFPVLYLLYFYRDNLRRYFLFSSLLGLLSAVLLMGVLLWGGFSEFFRYVFLTMPRYKELMSGKVYPVFDKLFLAVSVLIAANTFWVVFKFMQELHLNNGRLRVSVRSFMEKYLMEFSMLILSLLLFRAALGRSDWPHVAYSIPLTYILSIYIVIKHYGHKFLRGYVVTKTYTYLFVAVVAVIFSLGIYQIYRGDLIKENFPLGVKDSEIIPDNYRAAILFLKNNLAPDESFFTMTAEASWYYFIDRPSPSRFPVIIFAMPYFYQNEVVEGLEKNNVKFVLYRNSYWASRFDGFSNEERLPVIAKYIRDNFVFYRKIDDNEIWIRKTEAPFNQDTH